MKFIVSEMMKVKNDIESVLKTDQTSIVKAFIAGFSDENPLCKVYILTFLDKFISLNKL